MEKKSEREYQCLDCLQDVRGGSGAYRRMMDHLEAHHSEQANVIRLMECMGTKQYHQEIMNLFKIKK